LTGYDQYGIITVTNKTFLLIAQCKKYLPVGMAAGNEALRIFGIPIRYPYEEKKAIFCFSRNECARNEIIL